MPVKESGSGPHAVAARAPRSPTTAGHQAEVRGTAGRPAPLTRHYGNDSTRRRLLPRLGTLRRRNRRPLAEGPFPARVRSVPPGGLRPHGPVGPAAHRGRPVAAAGHQDVRGGAEARGGGPTARGGGPTAQDGEQKIGYE